MTRPILRRIFDLLAVTAAFILGLLAFDKSTFGAFMTALAVASYGCWCFYDGQGED